MNIPEMKLPKKKIREMVLDLRLTYALGIFTFLFVLFFCYDIRVLISIVLIYIVAKMIAALEDEVEEDAFWHIRDVPIFFLFIKQVYKLCKYKIIKKVKKMSKS